MTQRFNAVIALVSSLTLPGGGRVDLANTGIHGSPRPSLPLLMVFLQCVYIPLAKLWQRLAVKSCSAMSSQ